MLLELKYIPQQEGILWLNNVGTQEAGDAALSADMEECIVTVETGVADGGEGDTGNLAAGKGGVL